MAIFGNINTDSLVPVYNGVSSTDNAIVRYDGAQGDIQDTGILIDNDDNMTLADMGFVYANDGRVLMGYDSDSARAFFGAQEDRDVWVQGWLGRMKFLDGEVDISNNLVSLGILGDGPGYTHVPVLNIDATGANLVLGTLQIHTSNPQFVMVDSASESAQWIWDSQNDGLTLFLSSNQLFISPKFNAAGLFSVVPLTSQVFVSNDIPLIFWSTSNADPFNYILMDYSNNKGFGAETFFFGCNSKFIFAAGEDQNYIMGMSAAGVMHVGGGSYVLNNGAWLTLGAGNSGTCSLNLLQGSLKTTPASGDVERNVDGLYYTNTGATRQEIPLIQQSRVTTQFDKTNTTLANVTGLTATLVSAGIYRFTVTLFTTSSASGGVKAAISGTATATSIIYEGLTTNAGLTTETRASALGTTVGAVTAVTAAIIQTTGLIVVNAGGTLTVQFACNAAVGTSSVLTGSTFETKQIQ